MKPQQTTTTATTKHKIMSAVALAGLFACGVILGALIWGVAPARDAIAEEENPTAVVNPLPEEPCAALEILISKDLIPDDKINSSNDAYDHARQAGLYENLAANGCPDNKEMYSQKAKYHMEIAQGLNPYEYGVSTDARVCEKIEQELKRWLCINCDGVDRHLDNATTYAKLAERGCAENRGDYKQKALAEIEIATALSDAEKMSNNQVREVVETYKKLEMQEQARQIINKIQLLTDPAIDFIIQMQKIIEE